MGRLDACPDCGAPAAPATRRGRTRPAPREARAKFGWWPLAVLMALASVAGALAESQTEVPGGEAAGSAAVEPRPQSSTPFTPSPQEITPAEAEAVWSPSPARRDSRDSYLTAYAESHVDSSSERGDHSSGGYHGDGGAPNGGSDYYYDSPSPPSTAYGVPQTSYGPPHTGYPGPSPSSGYGYPEPTPHYGPPHPQPPPPPPPPPPVYGPPHFGHHRDQGHLSLPVLDIAIVLKILLKVVIFKLIVKFIGIICLLLFIPKFIHKKNKDSSSDDERMLSLLPGDAMLDDAVLMLWRDLSEAALRYAEGSSSAHR